MSAVAIDPYATAAPAGRFLYGLNPLAKLAAEASAAWTGRAVARSEMPSSSRACASSSAETAPPVSSACTSSTPVGWCATRASPTGT